MVDIAADVVLVYRRSTARTTDFDVASEIARGQCVTTPLLPGFALDLDGLFDR